MRRSYASAPCALLIIALGCSNLHAEPVQWKELTVNATAYNSVPWQTTKIKPAVAAWGTKLKPGMRVIAVSRDLIAKGLTNGTRVRIEGLPGVYTVRDKMAKRWRKKIDIYMGKDIAAARQWGIKKDLRIVWAVPPGQSIANR